MPIDPITGMGNRMAWAMKGLKPPNPSARAAAMLKPPTAPTAQRVLARPGVMRSATPMSNPSPNAMVALNKIVTPVKPIKPAIPVNGVVKPLR